MKVKVALSEGKLLNWMVGKCEGFDLKNPIDYINDWSYAGPIISREKINIRHTFTQGGYRTSDSVDAIHAEITLPNGSKVFDPNKVIWEYGSTDLIAAMRCYVTSKLGEEVEVPENLIQ